MNPETPHGMLLVFEGIDGSGKSLQARLLAENLRRQGQDILETSEPTEGIHSRDIRELLEKGRAHVTAQRETLLFTEDRRQHVKEVIRPALDAGKIVICDRYYYSTMAYQGAAGDDWRNIQAMNEVFAPKPDRVYLLETPVETAMARIRSSGRALITSFEEEAYLTRVEMLFKQFTDPIILRVDGTQEPEMLAQVILKDAIVVIQEGLGSGV